MLATILLFGLCSTASAQVPSVTIDEPEDEAVFDHQDGIEVSGTCAHANEDLGLRLTNTFTGGSWTFNGTVTSSAEGEWEYDGTWLLKGEGTWEVEVWYDSQPTVKAVHSGDVNGPPE